MRLTILERLLLLNVLPVEGNIMTIRIVHDLRKDLGLTEEELKKYNVREQDSQMVWDDEKYTLDVPVGEKALDIIAEAISKREREGRLTEQFIPLYERFVEKKEV